MINITHLLSCQSLVVCFTILIVCTLYDVHVHCTFNGLDSVSDEANVQFFFSIIRKDNADIVMHQNNVETVI